MSFVIPVALQIHFFSKNKNGIGYMQEPNRTLLIFYGRIIKIINCILIEEFNGE